MNESKLKGPPTIFSEQHLPFFIQALDLSVERQSRDKWACWLAVNQNAVPLAWL